jgi:5-oxoprolinase (ATP-hydrolysing) subunit A
MARQVDLNADMGESFGRWTLGDDEALMPHLTSANVACGFHGGDPHVMRRTVALALAHGVGIGAHVALPDLLGFGRRRMAVSAAELRDYVLYQAGAMKAFAEAAGGSLQHVKPHGSLYAMVQDDRELAGAVADAVAELGDGAALLLAGDAVREAAAQAGVAFVPEGYVDLDYAGDGSLVIERVKQLRDPEATADRAVRLVVDGVVPTLDGGELVLEARSICVHGDAPNAPAIAAAIRGKLEAAGVELAPLARLR